MHICIHIYDISFFLSIYMPYDVCDMISIFQTLHSQCAINLYKALLNFYSRRRPPPPPASYINATLVTKIQEPARKPSEVPGFGLLLRGAEPQMSQNQSPSSCNKRGECNWHPLKNSPDEPYNWLIVVARDISFPGPAMSDCDKAVWVKIRMITRWLLGGLLMRTGRPTGRASEVLALYKSPGREGGSGAHSVPMCQNNKWERKRLLRRDHVLRKRMQLCLDLLQQCKMWAWFQVFIHTCCYHLFRSLHL